MKKICKKNNSHIKKIVQIKPDTLKPIKIFESRKEACKFTGIEYSTLFYYLNDKAKTHEYKGFLWYYLDDWQQLTK